MALEGKLVGEMELVPMVPFKISFFLLGKVEKVVEKS